MFNIKMLNGISEKGLELLPVDHYKLSNDAENPDAILVRSANMLEMEFGPNLKAIARAGAGVNNIPIDKCTQKGIVVFNTPGANANGVKELVLASLFLSSRRICQGINWAQSLKGKGDEVPKLVEKGKSQFDGPEIKGKRIGVIGLGAIGVMVANDAVSLGMEVIGYDPFISVNAAWGLSSSVIRATSLDQIMSTCDYITVHVPLGSETKGMFNKDKFAIMKKGARVINLSRGGLVVNKDMLEALENETVACYVTDFPEDELIGNDKVITIPHLGASTPESEENCAVMAVNQVKDYLERGTIKNSVNFPDCDMVRSGSTRILTAHENVPNMVGQVTTILANNKLNIADMLTHHKNNIGFNMIDVDGKVNEQIYQAVKSIPGIKMVRIIE
ncbi:MAG TPA: 3-phosphoglycerate dehydrogenase family protein [Pseudobacteroides sp.]|uniref:3-phosphoglycerate dehydrogenase family protein n=1 Tax=Pseudobacteroides sp. TaxID=1968840 RepID=UPI002F94B330